MCKTVVSQKLRVCGLKIPLQCTEKFLSFDYIIPAKIWVTKLKLVCESPLFLSDPRRTVTCYFIFCVTELKSEPHNRGGTGTASKGCGCALCAGLIIFLKN
jgi:hypothetical protein